MASGIVGADNRPLSPRHLLINQHKLDRLNSSAKYFQFCIDNNIKRLQLSSWRTFKSGLQLRSNQRSTGIWQAASYGHVAAPIRQRLRQVDTVINCIIDRLFRQPVFFMPISQRYFKNCVSSQPINFCSFENSAIPI